jgi:hypothetical protein
MKRFRLAALVVTVLLAVMAWGQFGTRHVPAGQPPLLTLDRHSIAALRDDFNQAIGQTRIVVLLSPT